MKVFKSGELIKASDINSNFSKCIKTDLSNCPIIPCNKGGTGRTDCSIAYADKAGSATSAKSAEIAEIADVAKLANKATLAEVATIAKGLQLEEGSESIGIINVSSATRLIVKNNRIIYT